MRILFLWALLAPGAVQAQTVARVSFELERVGLETPKYSLVVGEDGEAKYYAETASKDGTAGPTVDRELKIAAATVTRIFELARAADQFRGRCQSGAKNIAFTGKKTLRYVGAGVTGECTFNYSDVKPVVAVTDIFQKMEATLESGRRMEFKRRFDRLGLDAEMITLGNLIEGNQASDLETIAPTLRAIADDTELLERVRSRAVAMLRQAGVGQ